MFKIQKLIKSHKYSRVSSRRGGRNKRGGWQISAKIINGEVGKNLKRLTKAQQLEISLK